VLQLEGDESAPELLAKIEGFLAEYGFPLPETVPLVADMLSVPLADRYQTLRLTPGRQKEETLRLLISVLLQRAAIQPLLFVVEDLHWADHATLELLDSVVDRLPAANMLAVVSCRPGFHHPWAARPQVSELALSPLPRTAARELVVAVAAETALPDAIVDRVVDRTRGAPLFIEELAKAMVESMSSRGQNLALERPASEFSMPATLQESVMARLHRLGGAKSVAQMAATLGREFGYELLRSVSRTDDERILLAHLSTLVRAQFLHQRGLPPRCTYMFRHELIQDAACDSLPERECQQYQLRADQALGRDFAGDRGGSP
jgi:predicted ATPase